MNKNENKIPEDMLPNPVSIDNDVHPDLMGEVFKKTQDNETCECVGECTCKKGHNQEDNEEDSPGLNDVIAMAIAHAINQKKLKQ